MGTRWRSCTLRRRVAYSSSLMTRRWSKPDSNCRSPLKPERGGLGWKALISGVRLDSR